MNLAIAPDTELVVRECQGEGVNVGGTRGKVFECVYGNGIECGLRNLRVGKDAARGRLTHRIPIRIGAGWRVVRFALVNGVTEPVAEYRSPRVRTGVGNQGLADTKGSAILRGSYPTDFPHDRRQREEEEPGDFVALCFVWFPDSRRK